MGIQAGISFDTFPKQGSWLGKSCDVCFNYDTTKKLRGTVVRDDRDEPHVTIIRLEDGRFVLATECMHTPPE